MQSYTTEPPCCGDTLRELNSELKCGTEKIVHCKVIHRQFPLA